MRDCENVDVRDRLPELLHERLAGAERERVLAHVRTCADCSAELDLLRAARQTVIASAPRVDAAAIARAVQRATAAPQEPTVRPRGAWASVPLRAAAAVVLMAAGAGGVLLARRDVSVPIPTSVPATATVPAAVAAAPTAVAQEPVAPAAPPAERPRAEAPASALGATFSDLSDDELAAVLRAIDGPDGSLPADPAPTPTVVTPEGAL